MSVIRSDPFSRAEVRGDLSSSRSRGGVMLFALMFLSVALIIMSRLNHDWVRDMRSQFVEILLPTLETISEPAVKIHRLRKKLGSYVEILSELERLKHENEKLKHWAWRARQLEREIAQYRRLLKSANPQGWNFVTGRVVADGRGPFARSALLNIGHEQGVKPGHPVVNGKGLIGRTLDVGRTASRVLLLTDLNSRVPVLIGEKGIRGLLIGTNADGPKISFVPSDAALETGDEVFTSGHGGLFPRGLRIGQVTPTTTGPEVNLHAQPDAIDYVSVLFFSGPSIETTGVVRSGISARDQDKDPVVALPVRRPHRLAVRRNSSVERAQ